MTSNPLRMVGQTFLSAPPANPVWWGRHSCLPHRLTLSGGADRNVCPTRPGTTSAGAMIRTATMPLTDAELLRRLEQFTAAFRSDFRRADQARWAAVYLLGLLRG